MCGNIFGDKVYRTVIPRNVRGFQRAPSHGRPVLLYDWRCAGSQAYIHFGERNAAPGTESCGMMAADEAKRRGLGRGLSALLGDETEDYASLDRLRLSKMVPIEFLHPGASQPRKRFDAESIASLVDSVREKGVLQPLLVRRHPEHANAYEIIAGERRWRARSRPPCRKFRLLSRS